MRENSNKLHEPDSVSILPACFGGVFEPVYSWNGGLRTWG